jgi:hypothetical protein
VTELSSRPKWRDLLSLPRSWSLRNEGEPHTLSLLAARSRKSGYAPVLMNESGRVHTGEQIHFPHLAKNERDMGHPQLWLGESFKRNLPPGKSFDRDDDFVAAEKMQRIPTGAKRKPRFW